MHKPPSNDFQRAVEDFKREFLRERLAAHGGNRTRTARALGIRRTFLIRLIHDFKPEEGPPGERTAGLCVSK